jgi:hypothetical protein
MSGARSSSRAYPVEEFLQALTAQLDRAQDALALKVSGTERPLTWALKDLAIDLRVFIEVTERGQVTWRSAGPGEDGASTVHLSLTSITRPMVEENSFRFQEDQDPRGIAQISDDAAFDPDEQRKLGWMGVRTVGQLRKLDPVAVEAIVGIPVTRLQAALQAASHPAVTSQEVVLRGGRPLLAIRGANLAGHAPPEVRMAGVPVEVLEWKPNRLLVKPQPQHTEGQVEVLTGGRRATAFFDLGPERAAEVAQRGVEYDVDARADAKADAQAKANGAAPGNGAVHGATPQNPAPTGGRP